MEVNTIGDRIRDLRVKRGLTQRELAEKLSVSNSAISNWETSRRLPSLDELKRISNFFQKSLSIFDMDENIKVYKDPEQHDELDQAIICKPLGYETSPIIKTSFFVSMSVLLLAFLIDFSCDVVILILGLFSLAYVLICFLSNRIKKHLTYTKRILIPMSQEVFFVHVKKDEEVKKIRKTMFIMMALLIFLDILLFVLIFLTVFPFPSLVNNIILSVYSVLVIMLTYHRYQSFKQSGITEKTVKYYHANKDLKLYLLPIGLFIEVLNFALIVSVLTLNRRIYSDILMNHLIVLVAFLIAGLSFIALTRYRSFIRGYNIYAVNQENERFPIMVQRKEQKIN